MPLPSYPSRRVRRRPRAVRTAVLFSLAALLSVAAPAATVPTPSFAADPVPVPFAWEEARVFIGQHTPTTLLGSEQQNGSLAMTELGSAGDISYNAIGFNINDGFIYGIRANKDANGTNHLVKIGRDGVTVDQGEISGMVSPVPSVGGTINTYTQGTFGGIQGAGGNSHLLYVRDYNDNNHNRNMWAVDVATKTATKITFPAGNPLIEGVADLTWAGGKAFLGARGSLIGASETEIFVVTEQPSGAFAVKKFPSPIPVRSQGRQFGAAWTLGNGMIGFADNRSGEVFLLDMASANGANITFSLYAQYDLGIDTSNNDGTSTPGGDVDLGIVKTGPVDYAVGETLSYSMTVTNHEETFVSSGSVLTDTVPEGLGEVASTTEGCTVVGRALTCVLGVLTAGETTEVQMTAKVLAESAHPEGQMINTAHIRGNEYDPVDPNNTSSTAAEPVPGVLLRTKTSDPVSGTHVIPGQKVSYTLTFNNSSRSAVKVAEVDMLTDVLDDATVEGPVVAQAPLTATMSGSQIAVTGTLAANTTATVTYSMRVKSPLPATASGTLRNFLVTEGNPPPSTCDPLTLLCTEHPVAGALSWNKVNDQTPAVALAGSEWTLTPYDDAAEPALVMASQIAVVDCVATTDAECTAADKNSAEGKFDVRGLSIGTYQLAETRAPAGYQQIQPIDIVVDRSVSFGDIVNTQVEEPTLPLTGGMGTTMFWALTGGFGFLALAALVLQQYRRMRA